MLTFKSLGLLTASLFLVACSCEHAVRDPIACPLDGGSMVDGASAGDAATRDGAVNIPDAADALDAHGLDANGFDAAAIDANDSDASNVLDATASGDAGESDAAIVHLDDTCDSACGEEQACMRQGVSYVCIDCYLRGYNAPTQVPALVTVTTAAQAAALRRYRSLQSVVIPDGPEIADILENLVCLDWVSSLTVGQTNDLEGLRNLQSAGVLELAVSPLTRSPSEIPPTLEGLRSLQFVYEALRINGAVSSLHGLEALETVGDLTLLGLNGVTSLAPLTALTTISGTLSIPSQLVSIDAPALQHVGGLVAYSTTLTSLDGLPPTSGRYTALVLETPNLTSTAQLSGLSHVTGDVRLAWSVPLDGLQDLVYVDGSVTLGQVCRPFQAPPGLRAIGGDLIIPALFYPPRGGVNCITSGETLGDLSELRSVGGTMVIFSSGFDSLDGLNQLQHLGGLNLSSNPYLTRIDALHNVVGVMHRDVHIYGHRQLSSLNGLEGVTDIAGRLLIHYNDALTSLDGLASLTSVGGMYSVASNPLLPSCEADGLAQRIAASCTCDDPNILPCYCSSECVCGGNDSAAICEP